MWFFRLRPNFGHVALFALALQAGMVFGHTHAYKHPSADNHLSLAAAYGACLSAERPHCPPADHDDNGKACAICWSTYLAKSAVLYPPPSLRLPSDAIEAHLPVRSAVSSRRNDTVHFQARAPPVAVLA